MAEPRGRVDITRMGSATAPPGNVMAPPGALPGAPPAFPQGAPGAPSAPQEGVEATQGSILPQTSLRGGAAPSGAPGAPGTITTREEAQDALDALPLRELTPVNRIRHIYGILSQLPGWNTLELSDQQSRASEILTYYGYPPATAGEVIMSAAETAGPMVAGGLASLPAYAGLGPIGGFAARTVVPGIAEVATREALARIRPMVTGEPAQPFQARSLEQATALGTSILMDGLVGGLGEAAIQTVERVRTAAPRDIGAITQRGSEVLFRAGTSPTIGRYGAALPGGGPLTGLENAMRHLMASNAYLTARDTEGQNAVTALFETFSSDLARAGDPAQVARGLTQMIRHRDALGRMVTRSAYGTIEQIMGTSLIDTRGLIARITALESPDVRDILSRIFHIPSDLPQGEFITRFARETPVMSWDGVQRLMTRLSRIRNLSPHTSRGRTAGALYHQMDQMVRDQMQLRLGVNAAPALAVWDAARAFHSEKTQALFGQILVRETFNRLMKDPSKLTEVVLRSPEATRTIREALERDIDIPMPAGVTTPGGRTRLTLRGLPFWQHHIQPTLIEGITRGMTDQHGRVVNPGALKRFTDTPTTARALDIAFGRGAATTLRELADAMTLMSEDRLGLIGQSGARIATQIQWLEKSFATGLAIGGLGMLGGYFYEDRQANIDAWAKNLAAISGAGLVTLELGSLFVAGLLNNRRMARSLIQAMNLKNARDLRKLASVTGHITSSMIREGLFGQEDVGTLMDFWMRGLSDAPQQTSQPAPVP